ncbi:type VI secretion system tip protein VgrG [Pseudomonas mediterranea]|uniref:type VI secretion system tip protein TssI/VgrG n=1 Tax=Pseudomonas mediterranea TaxID=183795 RepID=UPI0013183735|nr:type VI secretion system tip protein TssI/VgrG [Pseudomonas mediterranea]QHA85079.1 type VI secretion system tip protein VgrG [Pseudomonas mediterranea]
MPAPSAAQFRFTIDSLPDEFDVLAFEGTEAISRPFEFRIRFVSEHAELALERFLHRPAFLAFDTLGNGIHGQIADFAVGESGQRLTHYHATLMPRLSSLDLAFNRRIFQRRTVRQIITEVLKLHGLLEDAFRFQLGPTEYPPRDYCTQYEESDLAFIQRLFEEEGWHYHFEHGPQQHVLVVGDDQSRFRSLPPTPFVPDGAMVADEPTIRTFSVRVRGATSRVTRRDRDFEKPRLTLESAARHYPFGEEGTQPDREDYAYAQGRFLTLAQGRQTAQRALQRRQRDTCVAEGGSNQPALVSGHFMRLKNHGRGCWNQRWLLTWLRHEGSQPQVLEEAIGNVEDQPLEQGYGNRFKAIPWDVFYRPSVRHRRPLLVSETATVSGPQGREIHCDEYGRVKVRFHWDRAEGNPERSSCWVRVATGWAGDGFGTQLIPRVGMEVVVTFLAGDPDQPLITGCVPNQANPVPHGLPVNDTRSVFKSRSSPGGGGSNELHIEDRKGAERIYLRAERDLFANVRNDHVLEIGRDQRITLAGQRYSEVRGEEHHTVGGHRVTQLDADDFLTINGSLHAQVGETLVIRAGQVLQLECAGALTVKSGTQLTLEGGGHFLRIGADGIFSSIPIEQGGGPGPGAALRYKPARRPGEADEPVAGRTGTLTDVAAISQGATGPPAGSSPLPIGVLCKRCFLQAQAQARGLAIRL